MDVGGVAALPDHLSEDAVTSATGEPVVTVDGLFALVAGFTLAGLIGWRLVVRWE